MVDDGDQEQWGALRSETYRLMNSQMKDWHVRLTRVTYGEEVNRIVAVAIE